MNTVQPIRDKNKVSDIRDYLKYRSMRNYIFFSLGVYSGLRVSDLLMLKVGAVRNQTHITLTPIKTKNTKSKRKKITFKIHEELLPDLNAYMEGKSDDEYLFPSRQRKKISEEIQGPFDRTTAYRMLKKAAHQFSVSEIGCHTMRKTWGYHLYTEDPKRLALLMEMFGHEKISTTLRYLGITQDAMDDAISSLKYV